MQVQDHVVAARPLRHRLDRGIADHQVDHDHAAAQLLGELGALVHVLHGPGGHVQVGALELAGRGLGTVDRLHAVQEPVAPVHERLRIDVLVVLGEVEPALERLVHHPAVVLARKPELRLDRRAEQRAAELVQPLALDHDAGRRAVEGLDVGHRQAHVLQAQRLERLEAEHVADDRGGQVGDRAGLEQRQVVRDVGEVLPGGARHRVDPVGFGAIAVAGREAVGPDHGPGRGRGLARHCGGRLLGIDAFLWRDAKQRDHIGVARHVAGVPVTHLRVLHDPRAVALACLRGGLIHLAHCHVLRKSCASTVARRCDKYYLNVLIDPIS